MDHAHWLLHASSSLSTISCCDPRVIFAYHSATYSIDQVKTYNQVSQITHLQLPRRRMLKQLVFAAGRGLGQQPALLAGANAAAPFSRLISSSASSHADRGEDALHASVAGSPVDAGARGLGEAVEPSVTGGRGDDALHASKYGSKGDDRARRMGESVEPKVHEAFDIPSEGANAAPDPDSAGRVGGADMGAVVDAVGGMMHGDKRRTQQAVSRWVAGDVRLVEQEARCRCLLFHSSGVQGACG